MKPEYAKALLGVYAKRMRDVIHEVQANETDEIVVHKLAPDGGHGVRCEVLPVELRPEIIDT